MNEIDKIERKLAAIMFTDIFQYSRLMSRDENKALKLLSDHDRIVEDVILKHRGHVLKRMGDAIFAEFKSSLDALNCAINIQDALKKYNDAKAENERILVRIGLHQGDVMVKGDDLFGEGVNVAARLEPLADPGGICISKTLYHSVKAQVEINPILLGDIELKNILEKYTVYKIPSLYGDEFSSQKVFTTEDNQKYKYRIKKIQNLPVKYLSPKEIAFFSLLFCLLCIFFFSYATLDAFEIHAIISLLYETKFLIIIPVLLLILAMIYFYAAKSVRVVIDDIRGVDKLLEFLTSQIGYKPPIKDKGMLIFKPSFYHFLMYTARKIRALVDGNSIILSGNYMFINKLIKMIRSYETVD